MTPRSRTICTICRAAVTHGATYCEVIKPSKVPRIVRARKAAYHALHHRGRYVTDIARIFGQSYRLVWRHMR